MKKILTEICCGSIDDCIVAQECGADRIELVQAHQLGGLTPSIGTVKSALQHVNLPIEAIIRPRMSGFCYSEYDFEVMCIDAKEILNAGVDGLVFGFLNEDSTLDYEKTARFMEIASSANTCFHRAFDILSNQDDAIEQLIKLGVKRILTSGSKPDSYQGMSHIKYLNDTYGNYIDILIGGGITESNVKEIVTLTNVSQIHFGGTKYCIDSSAAINPDICFGSTKMPPNDSYIKVDKNRVLSIIKNIH